MVVAEAEAREEKKAAVAVVELGGLVVTAGGEKAADVDCSTDIFTLVYPFVA